MIALQFLLTAGIGALVGFAFSEWLNAPEGYEDETGFHYGKDMK